RRRHTTAASVRILGSRALRHARSGPAPRRALVGGGRSRTGGGRGRGAPRDRALRGRRDRARRRLPPGERDGGTARLSFRPASGEPFVGWHPALAVAHVWAWYPNPDGVFAESNPWLGPYGGIAAPAHHARNPAETFYSQLTHRVAGTIVLTLAALTIWESWRSRPFPWNAVSAPLWMAFGVYLIPSSDPESWPYGPQRFAEIFVDPLVLQHKLLALLPIAIGVITALRGAAVLPGRRLARALGVLALAGGATLFFHFHEG